MPIIPVRLVNADCVLPVGKKLPDLGHSVYVIFGQPIAPDDFASVPELLDEVQLRITTSKLTDGAATLGSVIPHGRHEAEGVARLGHVTQ